MHNDSLQSERGSTMVVSMIVLSSLLALGAVTIMSVGGGLTSSANDRHKKLALYAAESGAAAAITYLRVNQDAADHWLNYVTPQNQAPVSPTQIPGNALGSGGGSLLSADTKAWYEVTIYNNIGDPGYTAGTDEDGRIVLRSVGHGPNNSVATIELEIATGASTELAIRPCPGYGQRGMAEDNAGRNDCLSNVDSTIVSSYHPGN